ncbi:MAG: adenosylcobinamide-GDP ribazoletransferase [Elusimicrobiota bacterium]
MKSFIFALRFLTIIPLGFKHDSEKNTIAESIVSFPLVGLLIGIILAFTASLLGNLVPNLLLCIIVILVSAVITGGLHIDGLADTMDGFYAGRNRDEILSIMRDSHVGTMGVLGIVGIVLLKIGFLSALVSDVRFKALLIMPAVSRWSLVVAVYLFDYARQQGKAESFFKDLKLIRLLIATLSVLVIVYFVLGVIGCTALVFIFLVTCIFGLIIKKKIGGVTGDTLGALNEVNEVLVLLLLYAGRGFLV